MLNRIKKTLGIEDERSTVGQEVDTDMDVVFECLSNERRRVALREIANSSEKHPIQLGDLAVAVAAEEHDIDVSEVTTDQRKRVYVALYQSHMPKLAQQNVINWDKSRGLAHPTPLTYKCVEVLDYTEQTI